MSTMTQLTHPFVGVEFVEKVAAGVPWNVLGLTAGVLETASIELNNAGILLPEGEWRALRNQCDHLMALSQAYARAAVGQLDPTRADRERPDPPKLDPYPWVWDGHSKTDQMRSDTEMFRKGAPRGVLASMNYVFLPRPSYSQNVEDYR